MSNRNEQSQRRGRNNARLQNNHSSDGSRTSRGANSTRNRESNRSSDNRPNHGDKESKRAATLLHNRSEYIKSVRKILSWDFGIKLPHDMRGFKAKIVKILASPSYGNLDLNKSRLECFLDSCTVKQLKQFMTYVSLQDKLEDEPNTLMSDSDIISRFKKNQESITYIEDKNVDMLRDYFNKRIPTDFDEFDVIVNKETPYIITSGVNYPKEAFPRVPGCPEDLNQRLLIVEHGSENLRNERYMANRLEEFKSRGGLCAGMLTMVPKSYMTKRTIGIATSVAIALQKPLNNGIRKRSTKLNIDFRNTVSYARQHIQQRRILLNGTHSIDATDASDLISLDLITRLNPLLGEIIRDTTPRFVNSAAGPIEVKCIGLQGYPLTFTVMAVLISAILECYTDASTYCSNYGDDIIIDGQYDQVVAALEIFGFKINKLKSYDTTKSHFSESCGIYSLKDHFIPTYCHDITPVYLRKLNDSSLISFINNCIDKDLLTKQQVTKLAKLAKVYYIYPWTYQTSQFHINYDLYKNTDMDDKKIVFGGFTKPKIARKFSKSLHAYLPILGDRLANIHGFNKRESDLIIELYDLWERIKAKGLQYEVYENETSLVRTTVDQSSHELYFIIEKIEGIENLDKPLHDLSVFTEEKDLAFINQLRVDFERVFTFMCILCSDSRYFRSSYEEFDPNDYDEVLADNVFKHEYLEGVHIKEW